MNNQRAIIRYNEKSKGHTVMCHLGHLIEFIPDKGTAGSMLSSDLSYRHEGDRFDRMAQRCKGFGH